MSWHEKERELYRMALAQGGVFTLDQARRYGIDRKGASYRVRTGLWERLARGIYRLSFAPLSHDEDLVRIALWASSYRGLVAFSHETALALHGLSDLLPDRYHLTVPRGFSRKPRWQVVLHRRDLALADTEERPGYRVTTPLRTLLDVAETSRVPEEQLWLAVHQALDRGLVSRQGLEAALPGLSARARARLLRALRSHHLGAVPT